METKDELIRATLKQLLCVARKFARIEGLPIPVNATTAITTAEAHTIQAIGETEQLRVQDIATHFGITKSGASQMVTRLVNKGFLDKQPSPHNNKEFLLSLTELGWSAFHAHERFHGQDMTDLIERMHPFSLSQIATVAVMLESINSVMDERLTAQADD